MKSSVDAAVAIVPILKDLVVESPDLLDRLSVWLHKYAGLVVHVETDVTVTLDRKEWDHLVSSTLKEGLSHVK